MFLFRLARLIGGCTVHELSRRISYRELREWMEYYQMEPWGVEVDDLLSAAHMAQFANLYRDEKKRKTAYGAKDFLLFTGEEVAKTRAKLQRERRAAAKRAAAKPARSKAAAARDPLFQTKGAVIAPETLSFFFANAEIAQKKPKLDS